MTRQDFDPYEDGLRRGHRSDYVEHLRQLITQTSSDVLAVCRAWDNDQFGWPGYGDVNWVAGEISRAETAVRICRERFGAKKVM